jgi:dTDP-4-amino-4,6-dideoxygalactose transaminase
MQIPLINLQRQYHKLSQELNTALKDVLEQGQYILGPRVRELEAEIARLSGTSHAIGLANGTDALVLVLRALGIGPGDEVITSPFTFFASAECVSLLGATPVFADIDPGTYNIDPQSIKSKITPKTKAIIPVHIFGQPCPIKEVMALAKEHGLYVIEDACQAIGAAVEGQPVGSFGDAACYSFFPTKNLGGYGDGGMLVTNNQELADKIRILRAHGSTKKYFHTAVGYNSRLDEMQAAILLTKLKFLASWNARRRELAAVYDAALKEHVVIPEVLPAVESVYHLYVIRHANRDKLMNYLSQQGIASGVYYPLPLHLQEVYKDLGYQEGDLPVVDGLYKDVLALPLCPELTDEEQHYIIQHVLNFCKGA